MTDIDEITSAVTQKLAEKGLISGTKKRKTPTHWESYLVREFANHRYLNYLKWFRHEVGPFDPDDPIQKNGQLRRFCDLIIDVNDTLLVVEAKMKPTAGCISQLQQYIHLIPETPDLEYYWDKPINGMILTTMQDTSVQKVANQWGFMYEVYVPSFFEAWQQTMIDRYQKKNALGQ